MAPVCPCYAHKMLTSSTAALGSTHNTRSLRAPGHDAISPWYDVARRRRRSTNDSKKDHKQRIYNGKTHLYNRNRYNSS